MWRLRCQLCLTPHDTPADTESHDAVSPEIITWVSPAALGPHFSCFVSWATCSTSANSGISVATSKASSLHFLPLQNFAPKGASICLWSQANHAGSSVTLLPALFLLCAGRASPDQLLLELKTQARCQPFQAVPDHDSGALISHTEAALSASGVS